MSLLAFIKKLVNEGEVSNVSNEELPSYLRAEPEALLARIRAEKLAEKQAERDSKSKNKFSVPNKVPQATKSSSIPQNNPRKISRTINNGNVPEQKGLLEDQEIE